MWSDLLYRLRVLFERERIEKELDEELTSHLEHEADKLRRSGISQKEAMRSARLAFGNTTQVQQQVRDGRGIQLWDQCMADIRFAMRQLRRSPVFTFTALATLALSVGATVTMAGLVTSVLLRPLPYTQPDKLVGISFSGRSSKPSNEQVGSTAEFVKQHARSFERMTIYEEGSSGANLAIGGVTSEGAIQVAVQSVDHAFLPTLGVRPVLGRNFSEDEDRRMGSKAILLSYGLWQRMFDGNRDIVNRVVKLNGESATIVGVMPQGFSFGTDDPRALASVADVWQPLKLDSSDPGYFGTNYNMTGRLREGVTLAQAQEEMNALAQPLYQRHPYLKQWLTLSNQMPSLRLWPLKDVVVSNVRASLLTLTIAVCAVLLVACLNLAGLMAARTSRRQREIALRTALGATTGGILRLLVVECALLAIVGCAFGIVTAGFMQGLLIKNSPIILPQHDAPSLLPQIGITLPLALLVTLISGVVPSWRALRRNGPESLQSGHTIGSSLADVRLGKILLVTQTALTVLLLAGASLLLAIFLRLRATPLGVEAQHLTVAQVNLKGEEYSTLTPTMQFVDEVLAQLRRYPGVQHAAAVNGLPLDRGLNISMNLPNGQQRSVTVELRLVTPDYFRTMGIPLLAGRDFTDSDNEEGPQVIVASEALAKKFGLAPHPVGQSLKGMWGKDKKPVTVIGVVADARTHSLAEPPALLAYEPFQQQSDKTVKTLNGWFRTSFAIRSAADIDLEAAVRQAIRDADPGIPVSRFTTMQAMIDGSLARPKFLSLLTISFAVFALGLTVIGLFGLLSYQVSERTREIGVRIAFGATKGYILTFIMGRGVVLTLIGLALGSVASFMLPRLIRSMMNDSVYTAGTVSNSNTASTVVSVAAACAVMLLATVLGSYLPARKASLIEPLEALRTE
jgi:predicted permease